MLIRLPWLISRRRLIAAVLIDTALFAVLYPVCFQLRYGSWPEASTPLAVLMLFWLVTSYVHGRYYDHEDPRANPALKQVLRSLLALLISLAVYLGYNWLTASALGQQDSRSLLIPFLLILTGISAGAQLGLNRLLQARFVSPTTWMVLGMPDAVQALERAANWSRLPCRLAQANPQSLLAGVSGGELAGVVISDPQILDPGLFDQLLQLQAQGLEVLTTMGWCERVLQRFPTLLLSRSDLVRGEFAVPGGSLQRRLKRLGDVLVSATLLLLSLPLLLLAALLIRIEDRGPVFYSQLRSGFGGEHFRVWKLRSMRVDAERSGAQWAGRGDPRITRVGHWLRLTRVDELPQLLAVLTGAMSLIGPRPERPEFELELERQIPHYRLRHGIRPGLSGWAQVNYPYGASVEDAANKLSYDLYYLRNFSFWLDLLILLKTMRLVFNARGALPQEQPSP